ncbi:uncharacterized protein METZ01_LOCUS288379, partial [marine metagenome]
MTAGAKEISLAAGLGEEQGLKIEDSFTLKATQWDVWRAIMDPGIVA